MRTVFMSAVAGALLVSAYPQDSSVQRREDSVCRTEYKYTLFGKDNIATYADVVRFSLRGESNNDSNEEQIDNIMYSKDAALVGQLLVKYHQDSIPNLFTNTANPQIIDAYKGDLTCADYSLANASAPYYTQFAGPNDPFKTPLDFDISNHSAALFNSTVWSQVPQGNTVPIWPYVLRAAVASVGEKCNAMSDNCKKENVEHCDGLFNCRKSSTVPELFKSLTGTTTRFDPIYYQSKNELYPSWEKDDSLKLRQVLDDCGSSPVVFYSYENPDGFAWIVSSKEREGWRLDMVRSLDQERRSEVHTLKSIKENIAPGWPNLMFV